MNDAERVGQIFADWLSAIDDGAGGVDSENFLQVVVKSTDAHDLVRVSVEALPGERRTNVDITPLAAGALVAMNYLLRRAAEAEGSDRRQIIADLRVYLTERG